MSKILRVLAGLGIALIIPLASHAVTQTFTVTVTLQGVTRVIVSEEVDAETLDQVLNAALWQAVSASAFTIGADLDVLPMVTIPEQRVVVLNENHGRATVITFATRYGQTGENKFVVGGYIAKGEQNLSGSYHGSATMQAVFQ